MIGERGTVLSLMPQGRLPEFLAAEQIGVAVRQVCHCVRQLAAVRLPVLATVPARVRSALCQLLPQPVLKYRVGTRTCNPYDGAGVLRA